MFDTEGYLLNAHEELQVARHCPTFLHQLDPDKARCRIRILEGCYQSRVSSCILGTYRSRVPMRPSASCGCTQSDLEDDLRFPWFLSKDAKRTLSQIFIASIELRLLAGPICKILMRRDALSLPTANRSSVMSDVEECESSLSKWHNQNIKLMSPDPTGKVLADRSYIPATVHRTLLRLEYEFVTLRLFGCLLILILKFRYLISSLHHICLCLETPSTTTWATRLREASRLSLQQSSSSIVRILEDLLDLGAIGYLPVSA